MITDNSATGTAIAGFPPMKFAELEMIDATRNTIEIKKNNCFLWLNSIDLFVVSMFLLLSRTDLFCIVFFDIGSSN